VATGIQILRAGLAPTPPPSMLGVITRPSVAQYGQSARDGAGLV
jgi:hypothetical protein